MQVIFAASGDGILVDNEDFDSLNSFKWHLSADGYACYVEKVNGRWDKTIKYQMHRVLLGLGHGKIDKRIIDHIDRNRLNNQKSNLRIVSYSQNGMNRKVGSNNNSGYLGVSACKKSRRNPWQAAIKIQGRKFYLGNFPTPELAHEAYLAAKAKYHVFD